MSNLISKTRVNTGNLDTYEHWSVILLSTFWHTHFHTVFTTRSSSFHLPSVFPLSLYHLCHLLFIILLFQKPNFFKTPTLMTCEWHGWMTSTSSQLPSFSSSVAFTSFLCVSLHSTSFPTLSFPTAFLPLTRDHLPSSFTEVNTGSICCQQSSVIRLGSWTLARWSSLTS